MSNRLTGQDVGGSVVIGFGIGIAASALLFGFTVLFAYSGVPSEVLDYLNPLLLFFAGLVTCIGIGITLAVRSADSRPMWLGFILGVIAVCVLMAWWVSYALGQIGS